MALLRFATYLFFLFLISTWSGCRLHGQLELIKKVNSHVPEASGLAIVDNHLYVVSDKNGDIYQLTLEGERVDRLKTKTKDVEGITAMGNHFILVDEAQQKLYTYSKASDRLSFVKLDHPKMYNPKSGLEGITYDRYTNSVFVINEKDSGQLLQLDTNFVLIQQSFLGSFSDYSGVATTAGHIWIVSDEGRGIAQYDRDLNLIKLYSLDIDSPEGIAIDEKKKLIYIVSDTNSELGIYRLPE